MADEVELGPVEAAIVDAIGEAKHLAKVDVAGIAAMRATARRIDRQLENDNASPGTLLRYLDAFGLTPKSRESMGLIAKRAAKLEDKGPADDGKNGDELPATGTDGGAGRPARVAQLVGRAQQSRTRARRASR